MQKSGQIQAVIEVIDLWKQLENKPFDHILSQYFRDRRFIGSKDRQQISLYCYDMFRHKLQLEWLAEWGMNRACIEDELNYAHKVMAVLLCVLRRVSPGEISQLFSGEKYAPRQLDREERRMVERLWERKQFISRDGLSHEKMPEHVQVNTPKWLYDEMHIWGARRHEVLEAMNQPASIDLRVNTLKANRESVLKELQKQGIDVSATQYSSWGLRLGKRTNLNMLDVYKSGKVEIQDEGSQLLCELVDPRPGHLVIDYCAGAGGKSLAFAMTMKNKGKLVLCDTSDWRLNKSTDRLRRAGVFNVQDKIVLNTEAGDKALSQLQGSADVVFVDAPCSGTGTWRRNPDARFRLSQKELSELTSIQGEILKKAAELVKPGGYLVYATCSILAGENQGQVQHFTQEQSTFSLESIAFDGQKHEMLQLDPATYQTDGFFMAKLRRK